VDGLFDASEFKSVCFNKNLNFQDEKQDKIFYNSLFFKKGNEETAKVFHEEDFFPLKWQRMVLDLEHNDIKVQDRSIPAITI
jgi:hypothetical protein